MNKKLFVRSWGSSVPEARGQGGPDAGPMAGPLAAFCGGAAEGWGRRTALLFDELFDEGDCQKQCITQLHAIAVNAHRAARDQVRDLVIQLRRSARRCRGSDLRSDLWVGAPRRGPFDHRRRRELVALVPASGQGFQRRYCPSLSAFTASCRHFAI